MDQANSRGDVPAAGILLLPQVCILRRTSSLTLATGTATIIDFDEAIFDTSPETLVLPDMWDAGAPSRITVNDDGQWIFFGAIKTATPSSYELYAEIIINAAHTHGRRDYTYSGPSFGLNPFGKRILSASDYIQLRVTQVSGGDITLEYALLGAHRSQEDR